MTATRDSTKLAEMSKVTNCSPRCYFVRANGGTSHADPRNARCFVAGEPAPPPGKQLNHLPYCIQNRIARIGWPDTGDLRAETEKAGALARCYSLSTLEDRHRRYLEQFRCIRVGDLILVPDVTSRGAVCIATVTRGYWYFHDVPTHPYENAHRVSVRWDEDSRGVIRYDAESLGLSIRGGCWLWAFHAFDEARNGRLISSIERQRHLHDGRR